MKFSIVTLVLALGFAAAAPAPAAEDAAPLAERAGCGSIGYCSGGFCQIYTCTARGCTSTPTNQRC